MAVPFISKTDLDNYLGRPTEAEKSKIALDSACDEIRKVVEQELDFVEDDEVVLNSEGGEFLLLPETPVYNVTSVNGPGNVPLTANVNYVLDKELGALVTPRIGMHFLRGRQIYTVVYSHGYVEDDTAPGLPDGVLEWPSALRIVALQLATRIYEQGIVSSESVGGTSFSYSVPEGIGLSPMERDLVEKIVGPGRRR